MNDEIIEGFDENAWDELCRARLNRNQRDWYRALRAHTMYRGDGRQEKRTARVVDAWLEAHPTWCRHNQIKSPG